MGRNTGRVPAWRDALTPVAGTAQVYTITDPYSGGPPDPKQLPFVLFAGRFLLERYQQSQHGREHDNRCHQFRRVLRDSTPENAGPIPAPADHYVSVPFAAGENQCLTNQYEEVAPCFFNASPIAGKIQQIDVSGKFDGDGLRQRMLSTSIHRNRRAVSILRPQNESRRRLDVRAVLVAERRAIGSVRGLDSAVSRAGFASENRLCVPHDVTLSGSPGDQVRICWGYAENGPVDGSADSLYPTPRGRSKAAPAPHPRRRFYGPAKRRSIRPVTPAAWFE